jgi:hypothetical protein
MPQVRAGRAFFNISIPGAEHDLVEAGGQSGCRHVVVQHAYLDARVPACVRRAQRIDRRDGRYRLEGVPAGTYTLKVWHEALKIATPVKVTVKDGETVTVDLAVGEVDFSSRSISSRSASGNCNEPSSSRVTQRIA